MRLTPIETTQEIVTQITTMFSISIMQLDPKLVNMVSLDGPDGASKEKWERNSQLETINLHWLTKLIPLKQLILP